MDFTTKTTTTKMDLDTLKENSEEVMAITTQEATKKQIEAVSGYLVVTPLEYLTPFQRED
jgi:hypothetical protein